MLKILSIDDSKVIHAVLEEMLSVAKDVKIDHAYDGQSGYEKASADSYDLILLDWEMPRLTGIETLQKIRANGIATPIIMLTTKNNPADITLAFSSGANEYIMKPFVSDIIFTKIEDVLGKDVR